MEKIERHLRTRLTMRQLHVIVLLNKYQSVGQTSEHMKLDQPTVTKTLRDLQAIIGTPLFERTAMGVLPTAQGQLLAKYAKSILANMRRASQELSSLIGGAGGRLVIGVQLAAEPLLPFALERMRSAHPEVTITLVEGTNDQLVPALVDGEIDMIMGRKPQLLNFNDLKTEVLFQEQVWMVARSGHPLVQADKKIALKELLDYQWILPLKHMAVTYKLEVLLKEAGYELPENQVETVSRQLITALLLESDMIAPLPRHAVAESIAQGALTRLASDLETITGPITVTTSAHKEPTSLMSLMLKHLRESALAF